MNFDPVVACADIGSVKAGKFGWWSSKCCGNPTDSHSSPGELAKHVAVLLSYGKPVALGFECPLYVPLADCEEALTVARDGEGNRAWSAAAGLGAMGIGIAEVPWLLCDIRSKLGNSASPSAFLNWRDFQKSGSGLFIWEAFVSGGSKPKGDTKDNPHVRDAKLAVKTFRELRDKEAGNILKPPGRVLSLAGMALLRAGWSTDLTLLQAPVLVISPGRRK